MELIKKAAYLNGVMDGLKIDESTNEGKVIKLMAQLIDEMAQEVTDLSNQLNEANEMIQMLDEDMTDLFNDMYDDDDEDEEDFDEPIYECVCPNCGDSICLDGDLIAQGSIDCPNCGENLEFDFSDLEDDE